ncbi:protein of unknown function DUF29 [Gloeothece citriformis PCC 7424]|uniref:DUF29 domain-containing protein n=1 Tax=Gloeothece citriformis (strain PCC 7424) TaxID=65393 RepID=B7K9N3_GLOC7|nr:DUF29 domain-containing protein [Gloeothece citriformis]ACK70001.1 protein of unknown function DUF29 [Gloeothece citriformis PCC 7424]
MQTYEKDFYQWTIDQAQALRSRDDSSLDWNNLTLEIESLGKEQLHAVESYLKQLIAHQFKLQYVDDEYCRRGWQKEINNFLDQIEDRLTNSMKPKIDLEKVYRRARRDVLIDYPELEGILPEKCPDSLDDLLR